MKTGIYQYRTEYLYSCKTEKSRVKGERRMSRRDRVKRYLAMLLAFAMIFQQAGITTIADETEAVVAQQSEAAETKVQA